MTHVYAFTEYVYNELGIGGLKSRIYGWSRQLEKNAGLKLKMAQAAALPRWLHNSPPSLCALHKFCFSPCKPSAGISDSYNTY